MVTFIYIDPLLIVMKYEKVVTINLGNYESVKIGVTDASSFSECDKLLLDQVKELGVKLSTQLMKTLGVHE